MNGIAAHIDVAILDGNVFRRVFVYNCKAVVVDCRIARANGVAGNDRLVVAGTDSDAGVEFCRIEAFKSLDNLMETPFSPFLRHRYCRQTGYL